MTALTPYSEPPIPRIALEIERLRQRMDAAEARLNAQEAAPATSAGGTSMGRPLAMISAVAVVALVVISGTLAWQMKDHGGRPQPANVVQVPPAVSRTPQLPGQTLPGSGLNPQMAVQPLPATPQTPQWSPQTPPYRGQSAQSQRPGPPPTGQGAQMSRRKPPAPGQTFPAPVQMAQSSFRGIPPSPYFRPSIVLPPPVRPGYTW